MKLTQLEVAHRQLRMAIHTFFNGGDPVCVHALACNAREIYEKTCKAKGIRRFFDYVAANFPDSPAKDLWCTINDARNFFKHPQLRDEIDFSDDFNIYALLSAANDCMSLCGDDSPIGSAGRPCLDCGDS